MVIFGFYFESNCYVDYFHESISFTEIVNIILGQIIGTIECGGDTMSFLLNGGQVLIGVFIGKALYEKRQSVFNWKYSNNVITFVGRNSLLVYFLHQVIIPVVVGIILIFCGYHFGF